VCSFYVTYYLTKSFFKFLPWYLIAVMKHPVNFDVFRNVPCDERPEARLVSHGFCVFRSLAIEYADWSNRGPIALRDLEIIRVPGRRSAAKLLSKDEARRIAADVAKLADLLKRSTEIGK
jgi:hypothetical protein